MGKETIQTLKDLESSLLKRQDKAKQELIETNRELEMVRDLIRRMGKVVIGKGDKDDKEKIPPKYEMTMNQEKKVAYILFRLDEGDVKDIAEEMHRLEKGSDYESIYRRVQQVIIRMKKQFKVIGTGDYGSKYKLSKEKYSL